MQIKIKNHVFSVSFEYIGDSSFSKMHHKYCMIVRYNRKGQTFEYHANPNSFNPDDKHDCLFALQCVLSDASAGKLSFNDFCSEFGYIEDSIKSLKIHEACIETLDKVNLLLSDWEKVLNNLYELGL